MPRAIDPAERKRAPDGAMWLSQINGNVYQVMEQCAAAPNMTVPQAFRQAFRRQRWLGSVPVTMIPVITGEHSGEALARLLRLF